MKFDRLNVPNWPLPDLVAFNGRVHAIVDPSPRHILRELAAEFRNQVLL